MFDLRSDTLTKFSPHILNQIDFNKIGDDCHNEDQLVETLEAYCANLFGKEAALFMPTGTMSNQIGIRCLVPHGGELITEIGYHISYFESATTSSLSGIVINGVKTKSGILTVTDVIEAINHKARWTNLYAIPKAIAIENSINTYGGIIYPLECLIELHEYCKTRNLKIYLDGARIMNACASSIQKIKHYASHVDMLSMCFAKGLGAPFGAILLGNQELIEQARVYRKWYGGALHQSGLMAGIAQHLLQTNLHQFEIDNVHTQILYSKIKNHMGILCQPQTNMIFICVTNAEYFVNKLKAHGVLAIAWNPTLVRFVLSSLVARNEITQISRCIIAAHQDYTSSYFKHFVSEDII